MNKNAFYYDVKFENHEHVLDFHATDWVTLMSYIELWVQRYGPVVYMVRIYK